MKYYNGILLLLFLITGLLAGDNIKSLNLQYHFDMRRDHPTATLEYFGTDRLGYNFMFMDLNFDHNLKAGGVSDVYFEIMRYFKLATLGKYDVHFTVQYDDGTEPIEQIWLAGVNIGNIQLGPLNLSTEFLLKKDYRLKVNWQYTIVWFSEFWNGRIFFNGFLDYWANDVDNPRWPDFDPEFKASRFSFQAEPQVGWIISPNWRVGSEVEIDRGFLGSATGKLALTEKYRHNKWYFLPTVFVQYNF